MSVIAQSMTRRMIAVYTVSNVSWGAMPSYKRVQTCTPDPPVVGKVVGRNRIPIMDSREEEVHLRSCLQKSHQMYRFRRRSDLLRRMGYLLNRVRGQLRGSYHFYQNC